MDQTIRVLRNALDAAPNQWETRRHLAELLTAAGRPDEAARLIGEAATIPEDSSEALFAAQHLLSANPDRAAVVVEKILHANPSEPAALELKRRLEQLTPAGSSGQPSIPQRPVPPPPRRAQRPVPPPPRRPEAAAPSPTVLPIPAPPPRPVRGFVSSEYPGEASPASPALQAAPASPASVTAVPAPGTAKAATPPEERATAHPAEGAAARRLAVPGSASKARRAPAIPSASKPGAIVEAVVESERHRGQAMSWLGAGVLHALLLLVFLIWVLGSPSVPEAAIVVRAEEPPPPDSTPQMKSLQQRLPQTPSSSSAARSKVITAESASPLVIPEVEEFTVTDEPLGAGDTFGYGSGWGDGSGGGGGGVVQFFGEKQKAKRVAYIVDFSFSMISSVSEGKTRIDTLKDELIDSVSKLPPSMQFNIIYFSGTGWTAGEDPEGGEFQQRLQETMQGENPKVKIPWLTADTKTKKEQKSIIEAMPLAGQETGGGTMWSPPLKMALQMRQPPDLIYLLTDGAAHDSHTFVANLLQLNPTKIPIHTIAMEVPGDTAKRLADVAEKTGGKFTIILDGQVHTGERAKSYTDPKFNPIQ